MRNDPSVRPEPTENIRDQSHRLTVEQYAELDLPVDSYLDRTIFSFSYQETRFHAHAVYADNVLGSQLRVSASDEAGRDKIRAHLPDLLSTIFHGKEIKRADDSRSCTVQLPIAVTPDNVARLYFGQRFPGTDYSITNPGALPGEVPHKLIGQLLAPGAEYFKRSDLIYSFGEEIELPGFRFDNVGVTGEVTLDFSAENKVDLRLLSSRRLEEELDHFRLRYPASFIWGRGLEQDGEDKLHRVNLSVPLDQFFRALLESRRSDPKPAIGGGSWMQRTLDTLQADIRIDAVTVNGFHYYGVPAEQFRALQSSLPAEGS